ncbi:MAG: hypothetical protein GYB68_20000, partial [Chloroflexi bacterium]|nr:hypothetical protein [Chloroflexota bacterium]
DRDRCGSEVIQQAQGRALLDAALGRQTANRLLHNRINRQRWFITIEGMPSGDRRFAT